MMAIRQIAKKSMRMVKHAGQGIAYDFERKYYAQRRPIKPRTINLLVNDICNSRCVMCLIWKQKRDEELTPDELSQILRDPLFSEIRSVGVSGGEPTLRKDLPQLYEAMCKTLPKLKGTGIITNAIREKDVIERITQSAEICKAHGVTYTVMVSLDGVGEFHDKNRGREGNFESAVNVIRHFRDQTNLPLFIGCTVTKTNVWNMDETLDFCQKEGVYVRFRIAEFIKRLYNEGETTVIRNFDDDERYYLELFFARLEMAYEQDPKVQRTYRNIRNMISGASNRQMGCPYQSRAVVLDCRGQLQYCAPKSKIIGNALNESAQEIYNGNLAERRRILRHDCPTCIHDYHAPITFSEFMDDASARFWRKSLGVNSGLKISRFFS
jgi:MoaA/NifB/PqqE/SkfB family radical SAM enzyme